MSELRLELSKFKAGPGKADLERMGDFDPLSNGMFVFGVSCSSVLHGLLIDFHGLSFTRIGGFNMF